MLDLALILLVLFAALALVVKVMEKRAKPLEEGQYQNLSLIILVLFGLMLILRTCEQL